MARRVLKIFAFVLTVVLFASVFGGCSSDSENSIKSVDFPLLNGGEAGFVLFRSTKQTEAEIKMSLYVRDMLEEALAVDVPVKNENSPESTYELIVGTLSERPESAEVYNEIKDFRDNNSQDYIIKQIGTKLYISGMTDKALEGAVAHLIENFINQKQYTVSADYTYIYRKEYPLENMTLGGTEIKNFTIRVEKYPSYLVKNSATELQTALMEQTGYELPIVNITDDGKRYDNEICIGPMNGSVKMELKRDEHFNSVTINTDADLKIDDDGLLKNVDYGYFEAEVKNGSFYINGGSTYAINYGMSLVTEELLKGKGLPDGFKLNGTYDGSSTLLGDYGLTFAEEWNYTGSNSQIDSAVREKWTISRDTTAGPTELGEDEWDKQSRPGVYGENWWIQHNGNNGYLFEITKKSSDGYHAGRLISENKWAFRYGILDVRMVMATRNGACSAVWFAGGRPESNPNGFNEIDLYENFGYDSIKTSLHTWGSLAGESRHVMHKLDTDITATPQNGEHFWDTFHYLTLVWTDKEIGCYLDGELYALADITDEEFASMHLFTTIKLANGVGTKNYTSSNPQNYLDDVSKFFEIQAIDYVRLYQTNTIDSAFTYSDTHPNKQ